MNPSKHEHDLSYKTFRCPPDAKVTNVVKAERLDPKNGTGPIVYRTHLSIKSTRRSKYEPHIGNKQAKKIERLFS